MQLTEKAVRDYIVEGKLEASKLGRIWRISESDIKKFLENMKPVKDIAGKVLVEVTEETTE